MHLEITFVSFLGLDLPLSACHCECRGNISHELARVVETVDSWEEVVEGRYTHTSIAAVDPHDSHKHLILLPCRNEVAIKLGECTLDVSLKQHFQQGGQLWPAVGRVQAFHYKSLEQSIVENEALHSDRMVFHSIDEIPDGLFELSGSYVSTS